MTSSMFRVAIFAALLPGAMFAQSSSTKAKAPQTSQDARRVTTPQAQARIAREVMHELYTVPQYGVFDYLTYKVEGSKVTLMGSATIPVIKQNAEKAVKEIEGVEEVVNNIEVLPVYSADNQIRLAAYRAIYGHPSLQRYALQAIPSIHIIVNNNKITLEGAVLNKSDSQIAETQMKTLPGIFSVTNNLKLDQANGGTADRAK